MRVARPVVLSTEQRDMLESRARARSASARSVERARIVLLDDSGETQQRHTLEHAQHGQSRWTQREERAPDLA